MSTITPSAANHDEGDPLILITSRPTGKFPIFPNRVSNSRTLWFAILLQQEALVALIDSGSSHNFINCETTRASSLPYTLIPPFMVKFANGNVLRCDRCYKNMETIIQGKPMTVDLYELPIKGLDVVLGIRWLRHLGPVTIDWDRLMLKFLNSEW
ncbi:unnamed protein product [Linum trigynum]|uniref:Uncharacterized protein n=1 Tax=Linum trigynum TaxID=586398 RepID=A0AAV2GAS1_9ROSI